MRYKFIKDFVLNHTQITRTGSVSFQPQRKDFVNAIRDTESDGLDFVFDGVGGNCIGRGFRVLRRGRKLVEYGYPEFQEMLLGYAKLLLFRWLPNGKSGEFYGITAEYQKDKQPFFKDLPVLFGQSK
jgi:NADPH:quinone reductase-like Zn-dependent oxidoreductase